jgi:GxxExxY protein
MGSGFLEAVYQECLEKELRKSGIPFIAQPELQLMSKDEPLQQTYKHSVLSVSSVSSVVKNIRA